MTYNVFGGMLNLTESVISFCTPLKWFSVTVWHCVYVRSVADIVDTYRRQNVQSGRTQDRRRSRLRSLENVLAELLSVGHWCWERGHSRQFFYLLIVSSAYAIRADF